MSTPDTSSAKAGETSQQPQTTRPRPTRNSELRTIIRMCSLPELDARFHLAERGRVGYGPAQRHHRTGDPVHLPGRSVPGLDRPDVPARVRPHRHVAGAPGEDGVVAASEFALAGERLEPLGW